MKEIENNMYYHTGIKTSRNEDSVYAMKYASQQMMIDKLQKENQQLKEQLEQRYNIINKAREILGQYRHYTVSDEKQNKENENIVDMALEILNIDKGDE